jgi:hypothetical protein
MIRKVGEMRAMRGTSNFWTGLMVLESMMGLNN